jgi:hypothetical protein
MTAVLNHIKTMSALGFTSTSIYSYDSHEPAKIQDALTKLGFSVSCSVIENDIYLIKVTWQST